MSDALGDVHFTRVKQGYSPHEVEALVARARALLAVREAPNGDDTPLSLLERAQTVADEEVRSATSRSESIVAEARRQADLMLAEARERADQALAEAQAEADRMRGDAEHLKAARDEVANQVREFAEQLRASADWAQGHQQRR
jgi:cell division septum initiation protein DivIVA